jgi:hypothetical protein
VIVSHKYRFVFVKTFRTAGTSIEVYLSRHCGEADVVTPIIPAVDGHRPRNHRGWFNPLPELLAARRGVRGTLRDLATRRRFYNHISAERLRARLGPAVWSSYFKFCVERNPWEKTLSHHAMLRHQRGGALSLDDYLAGGAYALNLPLYAESRGARRLLVDRVLLYESLMDDLAEVLPALGVPFDGSLGVNAKSEYRVDRRPYRAVFDDRQRRIVERVFADEIALHGYEF